MLTLGHPALRGAAAIALVSLGATVARADAGFTDTAGRPFGASSVWNSPIRANPAIDANSAAMVAALSGGTNQQNALLYEFGIPVYSATSATPTVTVTCTEPWGSCPVAGQVRIPSDAKPHNGSDGAMVVIDWTTSTSYEFWQARRVSGTAWQTSWGAKVADVVDGTGLGGGSSTAANMSRLGGVVREREIAAAAIPHALSFSSNQSCNSYRYPATKSDGTSTAVGCIPQGARIQLDPGVAVDAIPGITAAERALAKALQTYGAYNVDRGGTRLGISFELNPNATTSAVYSAAGLQWDYYQLGRIPWNRLRVLATWDGAGGSAPTAPSNLAANDVRARSVTLSWSAATDDVGVVGYNVWRGDAAYANWVRVGQTNATSFSDTSVSAGTRYTYAVRAVDADGNISAGSDTVAVTTPRS